MRNTDKSWYLELRTCITSHNERVLIEYFAVAMPLKNEQTHEEDILVSAKRFSIPSPSSDVVINSCQVVCIGSRNVSANYRHNVRE